MKSSIRETVLLVLVPVVMLYAQTASKPEDGFVASEKYTNAFFGFSLPLPKEPALREIPASSKKDDSRDFVFGLQALRDAGIGIFDRPKLTIFVITATRPGNASSEEARKAASGPNGKMVKQIEIGGKEFWESKSEQKVPEGKMWEIAFAVALNGYVLQFNVESFDEKLAEQFERSIEAISFSDPAAAGTAGPGSQFYNPATPLTANTTGVPSSGGIGSQADERANAQTPPPQIGPGRDASAAVGARPGEFYDKELGLHFNYPVEMQTVDPSSAMERGHMNIYGVSGENDPEHQEAERCMRPLLYTQLPEDKAPRRAGNLDGVWVDDSKEYKESRKPEPIFANILLIEVVRDCLPEKLQKNENDALDNVAMSFVSLPGLQRAPMPLWYEVANQKIHMNSSAGRPEVNGQLSPVAIVVMSMATQWRGHLLAWVFSSNDTEIFNEMTKSQVQFGNGPLGTMFAGNIGPKGSGAPMSILPK